MRVQLGGRLSATETCDSTKTANATEAKSALKASASLAFSSPYAQASVNVTGENQTVDGKTHKSTTSNMTITWEAHGGNTLLANRYATNMMPRILRQRREDTNYN